MDVKAVQLIFYVIVCMQCWLFVVAAFLVSVVISPFLAVVSNKVFRVGYYFKILKMQGAV